MPDRLKSGLERLSGLDLSAVRVHYNSAEPARLNARAYTRGRDIHVAPGQERHLPHEGWHAVQQMQRRVEPTIQARALDVNDDDGLEREADVMGANALQTRRREWGDVAAEPQDLEAPPAAPGRPVVQGLFDWAINAMHNRRKVGVEVTEDRAGTNQTSRVNPTPAWGALTDYGRLNMWTHHATFPDAGGGHQTWHVAAYGTMVPTYFTRAGGAKEVWMRWGDVRLTEDYGDYEWIIRHPDAPQGVTHYRDRLAEVSNRRNELRTSLLGLGLGTTAFVLSTSIDPAAGEALFVNLRPTQNATSQITFESTDRAITRRALQEGITHGLERGQMGGRSNFMAPDPAVAATVTATAGLVAAPNVDNELIMSYVVGDLVHKIATLITGAGWAGDIAANFKQWRVLFPKSHPWQIYLQALTVPNTDPVRQNVRNALTGARDNVLDAVLTLFANKLLSLNVSTLWRPAHFTGVTDPGDVVTNAILGTAPGGGVPALVARLGAFLNQNSANFTVSEYDNVVSAMLDATQVQQSVVRSSGFATHAPDTTGFAFEDRAEVATTFPGLATTYDRIVALVDRY